ncbi:MAG: TonB-dependent receptor [Saprospiraceae bacterium]
MKPFYSLFIFLLGISSASAQSLSGLIVDDSNDPVVAAYVTHSQSEAHTHSNELGHFMLKEVSVGDTIYVNLLGYKTFSYVIDDLSKEVKIELTESIFDLGEVVVGQNNKRVNVVAAIDVNTSPVKSSQEILRKVPGLFIGQHAGGGKAEQIFLRGFDIDHGTDVGISVDGMPVNMVSHAHGQGYADLHFIIPEAIEQVDYGKGPYYADKGNFTTAGYVAFKTKDKLENSMISLEGGRFNFMRAVGMLKLIDTENHNLYVASEYMLSDGPFESSQNFVRNNLMLKYSGDIGNNTRLSVVASHFKSKWDASGQIPQRLVDQGVISRFGAVDDTEGGETGRTNLAINFTKPINDNSFIKSNFYYSLYDFELFSNFTFFLNDPENGDQIRQKEDRQIFGFESSWNHTSFFKKMDLDVELGVGLRADQVENVGLSSTLNRKQTITQYQLGDVDEKNLYAFANTEFDIGPLSIQPAVRLDYFRFNYVDELATLYDNQFQDRAIVSPKFNIIYNLNKKVQLFLKTGVGFHSNDTRVVLDDNATKESIIPAAYGADLGVFLKPFPRVFTNISLWYLELEQEFVYVGDAGVVEPSGSTRRLGVDFSFRYQITDWLFANGDFNYAYARSIEDPEGSDLIPLAPVITSTGGLTFNKKNFNAAIQTRWLKDRSANEDNSIVAEGYYITDFNANYTFNNITLGFAIENLFNQEWNETQFATETRLRDEVTPVEEIHFTPGTPFFIKGIMKYRF